MKKLILLISLFNILQSSAQQVAISKVVRAAMDAIDTNTIRSHIAYLADDRLKGRLPGTEGYQMAVDYVIDQFKTIGVQPAGDAGGFTQKLVLRKTALENSSVSALLQDKEGNTDSLIFSRDYIPMPHPIRTNTSAEGQLVFVGYELEIPGTYSDFQNCSFIILFASIPKFANSLSTASIISSGPHK
jgi:hypothetical protein